jgi:hypothetical protein
VQRPSTVLENIIKNVKTSNLFNEIEQLIDELIETIGKIRQNRETNASAVKEQNILVASLNYDVLSILCKDLLHNQRTKLLMP